MEAPVPAPAAPATSSGRLVYGNKAVLAPMVRVGTLPMRLLALELGCDIAFVEETIDKKIIASERRVNDELGTVDWVKDGTLVFRTHPLDHPNVFQIGTADAGLALKAAEQVVQHVDGIDINMGCPKHFSISGGMGAALLCKPQSIKEILSNLIRNLDKPVTCKIRLLENPADTLDLVKMIEKTGVAALTVHGRLVAERPHHPAHWDQIGLIRSAISIPLIANGDVLSHADIGRVRAETGASSVMIARAAMWNPSVFRPAGLLPLDDVVRRYIRLAVDAGAVYQNTKYVTMEMLKGASRLEEPRGQAVVHAKGMDEICRAWGVDPVRQPLRRLPVTDWPDYSSFDSISASSPSGKKARVGPPEERT